MVGLRRLGTIERSEHLQNMAKVEPEEKLPTVENCFYNLWRNIKCIFLQLHKMAMLVRSHFKVCSADKPNIFKSKIFTEDGKAWK